jgi:hypothetical protein
MRINPLEVAHDVEEEFAHFDVLCSAAAQLSQPPPFLLAQVLMKAASRLQQVPKRVRSIVRRAKAMAFRAILW